MVEVVARPEVLARTRKLRSTDAGSAHPVDRRPVPTPRGKETLLSGPLPRSGHPSLRRRVGARGLHGSQPRRTCERRRYGIGGTADPG